MKRVDLFEGVRTDTGAADKKSVAKSTGIVIIAFVIAAAAIAFLIVGQITAGAALDARIASVQTYLDDQSTIDTYTELTGLKTKTDEYSSYNTLISGGKAAVAAGRLFDAKVYSNITSNKPERVTITDIVYNNDSVTLSCTTTDNKPPADFAQKLDESGSFTSVKYTGFSQSEDGQVVFTIICSRGDAK